MITDLAKLYAAGAIDKPTWFQLSVREGKLAVDPETGAYLIASGGRGKGGSNKFYLITPNRARRLIRAVSVTEAIQKANQ